MSNYFLCDQCAVRHELYALTGDVDCWEYDHTIAAKVMYDHGGSQPYDVPYDVCEAFKPRKAMDR